MLFDLRYTLRRLAKAPAFTAVAVATLAIGLGANTAIFSLANAVLFRTLPIPESDRLVQVFGAEADAVSQTHSYPLYVDLREHCDTFSDVCGRAPVPAHLGIGEQPVQVQAALVSGNFFPTVGVAPSAGRLLMESDDLHLGAHPVAVVSFDLWQRLFNGDPGIVGSEITLNGSPFTVVGVTQQGFKGLTMRPTDVWAPIAMYDALKPNQVGREAHTLADRNSMWLRIYARIGPGIGIEHAEQRANIVWERIRSVRGDTFPGSFRLIPANEAKLGLATRAQTIDSVQLLTATVGMVLLIACANVANLVMAQTQDRRHELAVRLALGVGRWRLVRQLLVESVTLAVLGGAAGLTLSIWIRDIPALLIPESRTLSHDVIDPSIGWRVLGFTFGLSVLAGLVLGLIPALQAARIHLVPALKTRVGPERTKRLRFSVQHMLVAGQMAVSLVVLIVAGLLLRTLINLQTTDPGFDPNRVLLATVNLAQKDYDAQQAGLFYQQILARAETIPAVRGVTLADRVPMHAQYQTSMTVERYDYGADEHRRIHFNRVWPSYFSVMRIPVLRGRTFDGSAAAGSPPVVVVNRTMAERFWKGDALGKRVIVQDVPFEVVGIVADGKYHGVRESPKPFVYFSIAQYQALFGKPLKNVTLVARTAGDPLAIVPSIRDSVRDIAPNLAAPAFSTLHDHLGTDLAEERMSAILLASLGAVVVVLVTIGMYGLMSYGVARRTREIGLRMAMGARRRHIAGVVFGRGAVLIGLGVGIGLLVAFATTRILAHRLYGLSPTDPATFAGVAALLVVVALLACYVPARRASRTDPMIALRCE